jgi:hypothetical protein
MVILGDIEGYSLSATLATDGVTICSFSRSTLVVEAASQRYYSVRSKGNGSDPINVMHSFDRDDMKTDSNLMREVNDSSVS